VIYHVTIGGRAFEVEMGPDGIAVDGKPVDAALYHADGSPVHALHIDHATYRVLSRRLVKGRWKLGMRGSVLEADVIDERTKAIRDMAGAGAGPAGPRPVVAPMPGLVLRIEVREGDEVREGQGVAIVEAMKMENELRAVAPGRVTRILVKEGQAVEKDQILVELAAPEEAGA
jgi:acetyl/propionyl-CoA carboxylase alpha subunit